MKRLATLALAATAAVTVLAAMPRDAHAAYYVYCTGRIEIDQRDPDQMRTGRSRVCVLGTFDTRSDAENFVRRNLRGGVGSSCSC